MKKGKLLLLDPVVPGFAQGYAGHGKPQEIRRDDKARRSIGIFGKQSEEFIASYLQNLGFKILELNYKKFFGEIDIIAQKKDLVVFVEVKARKNSQISMLEIVRPSKQKKIILVAKSYIGRHNLYNVTCRFDVALLHIIGDQKPELMYVENAFGEQGY